MKSSRIGKIGENLTIIFLQKKGFKILDKNWTRHPVGEIDIIAQKNEKIYFVEVKTTTSDFNLAFEKFHQDKIKKFERVVRKYLIENNLVSKNFQLSVVFVKINEKTKKAEIKFFEHI